MSYKLVEDLQTKACPQVAVSQACRVLEVSRSGYYANVAVNRQRLTEPAVLCAASVHLKAAFAASHCPGLTTTDCWSLSDTFPLPKLKKITIGN